MIVNCRSGGRILRLNRDAVERSCSVWSRAFFVFSEFYTCTKVSCGKCKRVCPMNVDVTDNSRKRENGTECILCMECVKICPKGAL